jgi:hypothetical protein
MKKSTLLFLLLLLASPAWAGGLGMIVGGGVSSSAPVCGGSDSYVGPRGDDTYTSDGAAGITTGWNGNLAYTTPAGVSRICSIGGVFRYSATYADCRMAVYSSDGETLICQTTAKSITTLNYTEYLWTYGNSELSGSCTVSAETNYKIIYSCGGTGTSNISISVKSATSGDFKYESPKDLTSSGFDEYTIPTGTNSSSKKKVYFGVQ